MEINGLDVCCTSAHLVTLKCRRATLGCKIDNAISLGKDIDCDITKMFIIDNLIDVINRNNMCCDEKTLTDDQVCTIIDYLYTLLPEEC